MKVILASASPRRKELLSEIFDEFVVIRSNVSENVFDLSPKDMARELACKKARRVFTRNPNSLVIGADTIVVIDGKALGKPKNVLEATQMLRMLSGRWHKVFTGVAVFWKGGQITFVEESDVMFKSLTRIEIENYISTGSPFDKAGGYGLQDSGFVEFVVGSEKNVVGLPVERLKEELICGGVYGKF